MWSNGAILLTLIAIHSDGSIAVTSNDYLEKIVQRFGSANQLHSLVVGLGLDSFYCDESSGKVDNATSTAITTSTHAPTSIEGGVTDHATAKECLDLSRLTNRSSVSNGDVNGTEPGADKLKNQLYSACPALLYYTALASGRTHTDPTDHPHDHSHDDQSDHDHDPHVHSDHNHDDHDHDHHVHRDHNHDDRDHDHHVHRDHNHDDHDHDHHEADQPGHTNHDYEGSHHKQQHSKRNLPYQLWLYATLAVIIISLCGLAGVAAVPIIQRAIYRQLLHFLVALAVGTLTGDALLHLLPHALVPHDHAHGSTRHARSVHAHDHAHAEETSRAVYLGLVALVGILVFFVTERLVAVMHGRCTRQSRQRVSERLAAMSGLDPNHAEMIERKMKAYSHSTGANHCHDDTNTAQFLAGVRADSRRQCADSEMTELDTSTAVPLDRTASTDLADSHRSTLDVEFLPPEKPTPSSQTCLVDEPPTKPNSESAVTIANNSNHDNHTIHCHRFSAAERVDLPTRSSNPSAGVAVGAISTDAVALTETAADTLLPQCSAVTAPAAASNNNAASNSNFTVIIHEHEHRHHGHTHTHGHVHRHGSAQTAGMMAMVIIGDALHNLTDGLALGAAFAAGGVAGGVSTTVAVFCHELPHEIGDFAVLLKAGMSVRMAVFYNVVSSALCLLGMIVGMLLVSALPGFNSWLFAFIAGTFLYIALVDMLPELSVQTPSPAAGDNGDNSGANCATNAATEPRLSTLLLVQVAGMVVGAGIMLAIALHEESLHSIVTVV